MIFTHIQQWLSGGKGGNERTFCETMTYFWIQIVHFGIRSMPQCEETPKATTREFSQFIVVNPYVVDSHLWSDYYSMDVMMSLEAKDAMVLPDKKALPNLVSRETIRGGIRDL
jgi:hypothetical protein